MAPVGIALLRCVACGGVGQGLCKVDHRRRQGVEVTAVAKPQGCRPGLLEQQGACKHAVDHRIAADLPGDGRLRRSERRGQRLQRLDTRLPAAQFGEGRARDRQQSGIGQQHDSVTNGQMAGGQPVERAARQCRPEAIDRHLSAQAHHVYRCHRFCSCAGGHRGGPLCQNHCASATRQPPRQITAAAPRKRYLEPS